MTYEELLAKIDELNASVLCGCSDGKCELCLPAYALRAVVGLHKPIKTDEAMCNCNYCPEFNCGACRTFYPCTTIQAIEREL